MDFQLLEAFCREVQDDIFGLSAEIDASTASSCEKDMLAMLQSTVSHYVIEKRQLRDQLKSQCEALLEEINHKRELIGEVLVQGPVARGDLVNSEFTQSSSIIPPYKPLLDGLMIELEQLNAKVSERSQKRNKLWRKVISISEELHLTVPSMPDSLSDADIAVYESQADALDAERSLRLQRAEKVTASIRMMNEYLKDEIEMPSTGSGPEGQNLDLQHIEELEETSQGLATIYEERKALVEKLKSQLASLTSALEVPLRMPLTTVGEGTREGLEQLRAYLKELNELKLQKLDIFVNNSLSRIEQLWDQLYLDTTLRKTFNTQPASEEVLNEIDTEVSRLEALLASPERQQAIAALKKYQQIRANEEKLAEMSRDPGRLARRGFAASLKQEEQLRRFNDRHKPEVLAALAKLDKEWAASHGGETFLVDNKTLSTILAEEKSKEALNGKRRTSLGGRKRPLSSEHAGSRGANSLRPPPKLRSTISMPSLDQSRRPGNIRPPVRNALRDANAPASRNLVAANARRLNPVPNASAARRARMATPSTRPNAAGSIQKPRVPPQRQPHKPLMPIKPSEINLPTLTPGKPTHIGRFDTPRRSNPSQSSSESKKTGAKADSPPTSSTTAPAASQWESEQLQRMQNLEMSYFYETSVHESTPARQSFDYERDAF